MSTATLYPVADGDLLELTPTPGGSHYATVDEASPDDGDYLTGLAAYTKNDRLTLGTFAPATGSVVTQIVVTVRAKDVTMASTNVSIYLRAGGVNALIGSTGTLTTSFANYTLTKKINPLTGQVWTTSDLSGATIQVAVASGAASAGRVSQLFVTVTYVASGSATLIARPNADKAIGSLVAYPVSPATGWDKIDEAVEDTSDYVHIDNGSGTYGTFDLDAPSGSGVITHVVIHAKVQTTSTGGTPKAGVLVNTSTYAETLILLDTSEHEVTCALDLNPLTGVAWVWADIAAMYANVTATGPTSGATKIYQVWVEIVYTPPVYFDSIVCNSAGGGYVAVSGVLRGDASTPAKKEAQVRGLPWINQRAPGGSGEEPGSHGRGQTRFEPGNCRAGPGRLARRVRPA